MDNPKRVKTKVVCITPVKNESWILEAFLDCASQWADVIILLDHNSTDNCAQIAGQFSKVKLLRHESTSFDEGLRRKMLWGEVKKIPGRKLVIALDADEMISANWSNSPEWEFMLSAVPGTRFRFDWLEIQPGIEKAAVFQQVAAIVDEDTQFRFDDVNIHTPRIPFIESGIHHLKDIKLMHFIVIDPYRMFSKHRYLKSFEFLENGMSPWIACIAYQDTKVKIYDAPIVPVKEEWIKGYDWLNSYKTNEIMEQAYWYDSMVFDYFDRYGVDKFRKLNIWDTDWQSKARALGKQGNYQDPRSRLEKWIHRFIERHREELKMRTTLKWKLINKFGTTVLRAFGW